MTANKIRPSFTFPSKRVALVITAAVGIVTALTAYYQLLVASSYSSRLVATTHEYGCGGSNGRWCNFSSDIFRLFAYSAFYDDRPSLLSPPVVRVIVISDPFEELTKRKKNAQIYCFLHYDGGVIATRMKDDPKPVGAGWPLRKRDAREYIYTCPTVDEKTPRSVGLSTSRDANISTCLPVTVPRRPEVVRDFCVCVQVAYGRLDPYRLIEWFELLKLLGVSLVGVYDLSILEPGLKVLSYYAKEGLVDLRPTEEIYPGDHRHYLLQGSPVINDCMYRHMHEFRRIIVIDFDEVIVPRRHRNLSELVEYLDQTFSERNRKQPSANYAFRNAYFFLNLPPDETIESNMMLLRYRQRVPISPEGYSVKSIINPQACTNMHNHYCWGVTANYTKYGATASVGTEIALNQHYKKCHFYPNECQALMKNATQDDVMLRFRDVLVRKAGDVIKTMIQQSNG